MLVILGYLGLKDIHAMNGLKNFFGICINSVAAAYFIVRGAVNWPLALVMIVRGDGRADTPGRTSPGGSARRRRGWLSSSSASGSPLLLFLQRA